MRDAPGVEPERRKRRRFRVEVIPLVVAATAGAVTLVPYMLPHPGGSPTATGSGGSSGTSGASGASGTPRGGTGGSGGSSGGGVTPSGTNRLRSALDGTCLAQSPSHSTSAYLAACASGSPFEWTYTLGSGDTFELLNPTTGNCLAGSGYNYTYMVSCGSCQWP